MHEAWLELSGKRVRYIGAGEGQPVLFAAGLGISADFYKPNLTALARAGCRALAADLPGFGKTRGPFFGSSIMRITDHLIAVADALEISDAFWVGHSIGCQSVLHIAARRPDLVRGIVLAGPTGGYDHRLLHQVGALSRAALNEPWRLMKAVLRDYVRLSPFTYIGTWIKAAADDPVEIAARASCPALILVGTRDRVPRREFIAQLALKLGNAKVMKIAGGQHGLPLDAQDQFDAAVIEFVTTRRA